MNLIYQMQADYLKSACPSNATEDLRALTGSR